MTRLKTCARYCSYVILALCWGQNTFASLPTGVTGLATDWQNPLAALDSNNLPLALLQAQNQYPDRMTFGGYFSTALQTWNGSELHGLSGNRVLSDGGSALGVTAANVDLLGHLTRNIQLFSEIDGGFNGYPTYMPEALMVVGNLNQSPFYVAAGNFYLPFGLFPGNALVANTLESDAFASTNVSQVLVGLSNQYVDAYLVLFNGANHLNDFTSTVQYNLAWQAWSFSAGGGYLYDLRYTGSDIAAAYGTSQGRNNTPTSLLAGGQNGAVLLNSSVTNALTPTQSFSAAVEWVTTTSVPQALRVSSGRMQAWSVSGSYVRPVFKKPTLFSVAYSAVIHMDSVPLQLPAPIDQESVSLFGMQNQWLGYFQTEMWNNVYIGPEFSWIHFVNDKYTWESAVGLSVYL